MLPLYLQDKLRNFGIHSLPDLQQHNYLQVFAWLRDQFPSLSFKTLYDLHCLASEIPLNSLDSEAQLGIRQLYRQILPCYAPLPPEVMTTYLDLAYAQAEMAYLMEEIPVGAIVVTNNKIIAVAHNLTHVSHDTACHAEMQVLTAASNSLNSKYLAECDLYVTLEPCLMCSGAIINRRVKRVIFGAAEPKTGAVISQYQVFDNTAVNSHTEAIGPLDSEKYSALLRKFLKAKRV